MHTLLTHISQQQHDSNNKNNNKRFTFDIKNMSLPSSFTNNATILANAAAATAAADGDRKGGTSSTATTKNRNPKQVVSKATTATPTPVNTTLGSTLKYFEGYEIIVELKTGKRIQGTLQSVDDTMTMMLSVNDDDDGNKERIIEDDNLDATTTTTTSSTNLPSSNSNERSIRGSTIRYIQFPDNADMYSIVQIGKDRERNAVNKYKRTKRK
jgi:small nuclear ribonucleoprotein (snRNP)-like protein